MRLNLGANVFPDPGAVNVDYLPYPGVDVRCDVAALPFRDGAFAAVYAGHLLEHFAPAEAPALLAEWWRVVAPGGTLTVVTPDVAVAHAWFAAGRIDAGELARIRLGLTGVRGRDHLAEYTAGTLLGVMAAYLPFAALSPVDLAAYPSPPLVSRIGWQCGWIAGKAAG